MTDQGFIDVGDRLVVRIEGFPVGHAEVTEIDASGTTVVFNGKSFLLPLAVHDYERVEHDVPDGVDTNATTGDAKVLDAEDIAAVGGLGSERKRDIKNDHAIKPGGGYMYQEMGF